MFYKLKRKYGKYAVKNLALYATIAFAAGYLLLSTRPGYEFFARWLAFFPREVLHGQAWRILTTILYPPFAGSGLLFALVGIYIYYNFATFVEQTMGEFEFNLYFFGSFLCGELGVILYYLITGVNAPFRPVYTQFSVFMAFAILYPDLRVLLFLLVPVKAKYFAAFEVVLYLWQFFTGDLYTKIAIAAAFVPILLFYRFVSQDRGGGGNIITNFQERLRQARRRKQWRDKWK